MRSDQKNNRLLFGQMLRKTRQESGVTQKQIAQAVGVSQTLISQVESGSRTLSSDAVAKLFDELNVDSSQFFAGSQTQGKVFTELGAAWQAYEDAAASEAFLLDCIIRAVELMQEVMRKASASIEIQELESYRKFFAPDQWKHTHRKIQERREEEAARKRSSTAILGDEETVRRLDRIFQRAPMLRGEELEILAILSEKLANSANKTNSNKEAQKEAGYAE